MGRPRKEQTVQKVSAETGVEAADLERLPEEALEKIDAAIPDNQDIKDSEVKEKRKIGHHPITKEPVYVE
jgi:hypothetical protein